jgi:hypothetical protein
MCGGEGGWGDVYRRNREAYQGGSDCPAPYKCHVGTSSRSPVLHFVSSGGDRLLAAYPRTVNEKNIRLFFCRSIRVYTRGRSLLCMAASISEQVPAPQREERVRERAGPLSLFPTVSAVVRRGDDRFSLIMVKCTTDIIKCHYLKRRLAHSYFS